MIYTITYKYNGKMTFKNVEADTEEKAMELLKEELFDNYKDWCDRYNKKVIIKNFNKRYKI
jgi:hypothetical protein